MVFLCFRPTGPSPGGILRQPGPPGPYGPSQSLPSVGGLPGLGSVRPYGTPAQQPFSQVSNMPPTSQVLFGFVSKCQDFKNELKNMNSLKQTVSSLSVHCNNSFTGER